MPARINSPQWLGILRRLGIVGSPAWALDEVVRPVALVDASQAPIQAISTSPIYGAPATAGWGSHPVGSVIADTGPLAAGTYDFTIGFSTEGVPAYAALQRRNAANTGNVWQWITCLNRETFTWRATLTIADGERLRATPHSVDFPGQVVIFAAPV